MIYFHKGCLIIENDKCFVWGGKPFPSLYLAKLYIDKIAFKYLENSIVK